MPDTHCLSSTRRWIQEFVVGLNLCPFAAPVLHRDAWRIRAIDGDTELCLSALADECHYLENAAAIDTSLLVLTSTCSRFEDYLNLLEMAEHLLVDLNYEGVFQLASFHPQYRFEGVDVDAVENYTNRSPLPILQILREASVTNALTRVKDTEAVVAQNIETMRALGVSEVKKMLRQIG